MWRLWILGLLPLLTQCGKYEKETELVPTTYILSENSLYNSGFEFWQRGLDIAVENDKTLYTADRWYVSNQLGTDAKVNVSRSIGQTPQARYGYRLEVTHSPQEHSGDLAIFQTLDSRTATRFRGNKISFSVLVKALNHVNRVGIQFLYNTEEKKVNRPIGQERIFEVTSNEFSLLTVQGQDLGVQIGPNGVIGVRIRMAGVSTGNLPNPRNGLILENAMMNPGPLNGDYRPRFNSEADELIACQRFFEKSQDTDRAVPKVKDSAGAFAISFPDSTRAPMLFSVPFRVTKRTVPEFVTYDFNGDPNFFRFDKSDSQVAQLEACGMNSATVRIPDNANPRQTVQFGWTADAEI